MNRSRQVPNENRNGNKIVYNNKREIKLKVGERKEIKEPFCGIIKTGICSSYSKIYKNFKREWGSFAPHPPTKGKDEQINSGCSPP